MAARKRRNGNGGGYRPFDVEVSGRLGSIETQLTEGNRRFDNVEKGIVGLSGQLGDIAKKLSDHTETETEIWNKFSISVGEVREKIENPKLPLRPLFNQLIIPTSVLIISAIMLNWFLHLYGP